MSFKDREQRLDEVYEKHRHKLYIVALAITKNEVLADGGFKYPVEISGQEFAFEITSSTTNQQFIVKGKLSPQEESSGFATKEIKENLTDLKPVRIQLAEDEKSRRKLFVNLTPKLRIDKSASPDSITDSLSVATLRFDNSAVIVNDKHYAGRISARLSSSSGHASLAYVNIRGIGKIEFALVPFKDAGIIGTLEGDRLHLPIHEGKTVDIYGVRNGDFNTSFPEGAYHVWGRLREKAKFTDPDTIKRLIKKMEPANPKRQTTQRLLEAVQEGRETVMGYGIRSQPH